MGLEGRSLVSVWDLTCGEIRGLLEQAGEFAAAGGGGLGAGRILATLFYEPSTRTRLSFESAMLRLGGQTLGFAEAASSSVAKGESIADTVRMVGAYSDIVVQRHPWEGAAKVAADAASVPVVNAGDGGHEHPTQTLTDLFALQRRHGRLGGLTVGLCGDLKYGRTVHSLAPVLARFGSRCVCIAPPELAMPERFMAEVAELSGQRPQETADLAAALPELDCLYMTRIQKERFPDKSAYERLKGSYVLDRALLDRAPEHLSILHPLPRVDEIPPEVDADPRAAYFEQAAGGVFVRMALIAALLGLVDWPDASEEREPAQIAREQRRRRPQADVGACDNLKCVTHHEPGLAPDYLIVSDDPPLLVCEYCEWEKRPLPLSLESEG